MIAIYKKEISIFFSTIIGPLIIGLFLLINGLLLWSDLSSVNILDNSYASMDTFFFVSPLMFLFFISAISMSTFSAEYSSGNIENLITKPISFFQIIIGKFLAIMTFVFIAVAPTFLYILTIYFLGETSGNLDMAGIFGSYIGLFLLSSIFASIGVFSSALTDNQIVSFVLAIIISIIFYYGFDLLSKVDFFKSIDIILQNFGISYHYNFMSKGLLRGSDIFYFISVSGLFLKFCEFVILRKVK